MVDFIPQEEDSKHSASPWPCQTTHKYVHHWDHHKIWVDSVATLTLQRWPQTIIFSSSFVCFLNTAYSDIVQMSRHCRAPCTSGCRGATAFTGWKHMVLFEGGRRLLTKIETIWGNSCTMSNAVKFSHAELVNSVKWKCEALLCG